MGMGARWSNFCGTTRANTASANLGNESEDVVHDLLE